MSDQSMACCPPAEITLQNDALCVRIKTLGAEMTSIRNKDGVERLWQGDPTFWSGQAPLLFPVAGAFRDDEYILNGKTYSMPKHGFARTRLFQIEAQSEASATFLLSGEAAWHEGFPFDYALRVRYTLEANRIKIEYLVQNLQDTPLYACIGAHEGYACPDGIEAYELLFDEDEGGFVQNSLLSGGLMTRTAQAMPLENNALALRNQDFEDATLIFLTLKSHGVTLRRRGGAAIAHVDFSDFHYLLVWTIPGAPYLCIEPWSNHPDFENTDKQLPAKPGVMAIAARQEQTLTHTLTID